MKLEAIPIPVKYANRVVGLYHRHNDPTVGGLFAIGAISGNELQGVAIVGRPVARLLDNGYTAEVLRVCTLPDAQKGTNSFLYGRSWRAWQAMGGRKMITYTLRTESGASLRGAGWEQVEIKPAGGNGWHTRPRDHQDVFDLEKHRWQVGSDDFPEIHPKEFRLFESVNGQLELL